MLHEAGVLSCDHACVVSVQSTMITAAGNTGFTLSRMVASLLKKTADLADDGPPNIIIIITDRLYPNQ